MYGSTLSFCATFANDIFVNSCLFTWSLPKWGLLLKERMTPMETNYFLYEISKFIWEATVKVTELLPLKVYPFNLLVFHAPNPRKKYKLFRLCERLHTYKTEYVLFYRFWSILPSLHATLKVTSELKILEVS